MDCRKVFFGCNDFPICLGIRLDVTLSVQEKKKDTAQICFPIHWSKIRQKYEQTKLHLSSRPILSYPYNVINGGATLPLSTRLVQDTDFNIFSTSPIWKGPEWLWRIRRRRRRRGLLLSVVSTSRSSPMVVVCPSMSLQSSSHTLQPLLQCLLHRPFAQFYCIAHFDPASELDPHSLLRILIYKCFLPYQVPKIIFGSSHCSVINHLIGNMFNI